MSPSFLSPSSISRQRTSPNMADVLMAESSAAGSSSLTRRQHLAKTFEAYRAELDADVNIGHHFQRTWIYPDSKGCNLADTR